MPAKAPIQSSYRVKLLIIAMIMLLFGAYFAYDGWIGYDKKNEPRLAYDALVQAETPNIREVWEVMADENGWSKSAPKAPYKPADMMTQKIIFVILSLIGSYFLFGWFRSGGRFTESTPNGVTDQSGKLAKWDAISEVDLRRWDAKGIAIVHFEQAGKKSRIVLDDWKMETQPTRLVVAEIKQQLDIELDDADKIALGLMSAEDQVKGAEEGTEEGAEEAEARADNAETSAASEDDTKPVEQDDTRPVA